MKFNLIVLLALFALVASFASVQATDREVCSHTSTKESCLECCELMGYPKDSTAAYAYQGFNCVCHGDPTD